MSTVGESTVLGVGGSAPQGAGRNEEFSGSSVGVVHRLILWWRQR